MHATVTHVTVTNPAVAGASKIASIVPRIISAGMPIPAPRIPLGMGSLSVEAEARDMRAAGKSGLRLGSRRGHRDQHAVSVTGKAETDLVTIEDDGPGIPFFRADPARRKRIPGMGLGLAKTRRVHLPPSRLHPSAIRYTIAARLTQCSGRVSTETCISRTCCISAARFVSTAVFAPH